MKQSQRAAQQLIRDSLKTRGLRKMAPGPNAAANKKKAKKKALAKHSKAMDEANSKYLASIDPAFRESYTEEKKREAEEKAARVQQQKEIDKSKKRKKMPVERTEQALKRTYVVLPKADKKQQQQKKSMKKKEKKQKKTDDEGIDEDENDGGEEIDFDEEEDDDAIIDSIFGKEEDDDDEDDEDEPQPKKKKQTHQIEEDEIEEEEEIEEDGEEEEEEIEEEDPEALLLPSEFPSAPHSFEISLRKNLLVFHCDLHKIPEKFVNVDVQKDRLHVDTKGFSKKMEIHTKLPWKIRVHSDQAVAEINRNQQLVVKMPIAAMPEAVKKRELAKISQKQAAKYIRFKPEQNLKLKQLMDREKAKDDRKMQSAERIHILKQKAVERKEARKAKKAQKKNKNSSSSSLPSSSEKKNQQQKQQQQKKANIKKQQREEKQRAESEKIEAQKEMIDRIADEHDAIRAVRLQKQAANAATIY